MKEDDPLFLWRLAADLSVEDAAILIAGGDPSAVDYINVSFNDAEPCKRTTGHDGFVPVITALKNAILREHLPARLHYQARELTSLSPSPEENFWVVSKTKLTDGVSLDTPSDQNFGPDFDSLHIAKEPNWSATMVDVDDLKSWLRRRGLSQGFFFPERPTETGGQLDEAMRPGHEHFAPELALAVEVWQALLPERTFKAGVKSAVEAWITANRDAWQGDEPISGAAKERISTLVNWNKGGGAPKTGG